jgi:hypothetical protein
VDTTLYVKKNINIFLEIKSLWESKLSSRMTTIENNLALHIVKQEFGEVAKIIAGLLIKKKCCPFQMICKELEMEKRLVRDLKNQNRFSLKSIKLKVSQILSILIVHRLVTFKINSRDVVEYYFNTKSTLFRLRHPQ